MLKITKYLWILLLIVTIGGIWYPVLGYFLVIVFATLLVISPFRGRWFCGNLCPRGSFSDFIVSKVTLNKKIPKIFSNLWLRYFLVAFMMVFMTFRIVQTEGMFQKIGMVFVAICIVTSLISIFFGVVISPRTWCTFCPMGTVQRTLGKNKMKIKVDKNKCIKCGICHNVCPMQLKVNEILNNPDCIKCGRCIKACPKKAIRFKK